MKVGDIVYKINLPLYYGVVISCGLPPSRPDRNDHKRAVVFWSDGDMVGCNKEQNLWIINEG